MYTKKVKEEKIIQLHILLKEVILWNLKNHIVFEYRKIGMNFYKLYNSHVINR